MRSCDVWLMLIRNTSAPTSNSRAMIGRSEEAGPSVATILVRRRRLIGLGHRAGPPSEAEVFAGRRRCRDQRRVLLERTRRGLLARIGELHGPRPLLSRINLEEAGAFEPAGEAV